ncbi:16S rRNA (cytosine(1402)-N(4))-methyltransferase RsmH [Luteococcus japonicus]|uniref:Ribosomal RNA small subunit methyltransferase H n=1 Tax=Luteococcus japonicus LSP_Lj1 TaxID=1255658 RepID=A0A1R4KMC5_9ACTN|nr:16S rRNA (cytosine(1402)-N(4))-methyltransferase RsmH [Luteococcus japonicus]SJN45399.1 rRNA small subunit methyltransferase H [Luteococcus japonicus LSP_Lj1]
MVGTELTEESVEAVVDPARIHIPVMRDRILELLAPALEAPGSIHVDGTLGMGGHAESVLQACPTARVIGIDRDPNALAIATNRLEGFGDRFTPVEAVYDELPEVLEELGVRHIDSMLLDLGLSSMQIDRRERGFAYSVDAPLDMRMDGKQELTAAGVLNTYEPRDLVRILRVYGEERFADRIVRRVVAAREVEPFTDSARLVQVISDAIPMAARKTGGHPAKRTFQALRIEVNAELEALEGVLPAALDALTVGGRLAVLAYHSLEDRMVKNLFRTGSTDSAPRNLPVVPESMQPELRLLTRGAEKASEDETIANPRAASARLRVAERIRRAR